MIEPPTIVVLGDPMIDEWRVFSLLKPKGPEGVPVTRFNGVTVRMPGGALSLAASLTAYDDTFAVTFLDVDRFPDRRRVWNPDTKHVYPGSAVYVPLGYEHYKWASNRTTIKRRYVIDESDRKRILFREDEDVICTATVPVTRVIHKLDAIQPVAVVLCDYGKGALWPSYITDAVIRWWLDGRSTRGQLLVVDGKPALHSWLLGSKALRSDPRVIFRCNAVEAERLAYFDPIDGGASYIVTSGEGGVLVKMPHQTATVRASSSVVSTPIGVRADFGMRRTRPPKSIVAAGDAFTAALVGERLLDPTTDLVTIVQRADQLARVACAESPFTVRLTRHYRTLARAVDTFAEDDCHVSR